MCVVWVLAVAAPGAVQAQGLPAPPNPAQSRPALTQPAGPSVQGNKGEGWIRPQAKASINARHSHVSGNKGEGWIRPQFEDGATSWWVYLLALLGF